MKILLSFAILLQLSFATSAQTFEYKYRNPADSSYNCYLTVRPDSKNIKGLIVRDYSSLPDTAKSSPYRFLELSIQNGFMTVYTVTSKFFPELYYDDTPAQLLDEIIQEVLIRYAIPRQHIFMGGISASGTRALRFAQFCREGKSRYGHQVRGVFMVDSPLDLERFYRSAQRVKERNIANSMLEEAELVLQAFPEKLGGSPDEFPERYREASVFSFSHPMGGNAIFCKKLPMIIYHEPDIDWWLEEKHCSYYDINSFDIAGFVNRLRLMGNKDVKLLTTSGKGFDRNGNRKPHSWTIVNEQELMSWILETIE